METAVEPVEVAGYHEDPVVQPVGVAVGLVVIWMVWALAREAGSASVEPVGVDFFMFFRGISTGAFVRLFAFLGGSRDGVAASSVGLRLRGMISLKRTKKKLVRQFDVKKKRKRMLN